MNDAVQAKIGGECFFVDSESKHFSEVKSEPGLVQTGPSFSQLAPDASANLLQVVERLRVQFHSQWEQALSNDPGPSEMTVEVSFAFEGGINAWVIAGKSTAGIKASFKWIK